MLKKILIVVLPLLALAGGTAAGTLLMPKAEDQEPMVTDGEQLANADPGDTHKESGTEAAEYIEKGEAAWFSFPNQFFVPVVHRGNISGMIVLNLTIETTTESKDSVEAQEHRLRDALLRALIMHANSGGFSGNFTADSQLQHLRATLLQAAKDVAGDKVDAVLIEDIGLSGA